MKHGSAVVWREVLHGIKHQGDRADHHHLKIVTGTASLKDLTRGDLGRNHRIRAVRQHRHLIGELDLGRIDLEAGKCTDLSLRIAGAGR